MRSAASLPARDYKARAASRAAEKEDRRFINEAFRNKTGCASVLLSSRVEGTARRPRRYRADLPNGSARVPSGEACSWATKGVQVRRYSRCPCPLALSRSPLSIPSLCCSLFSHRLQTSPNPSLSLSLSLSFVGLRVFRKHQSSMKCHFPQISINSHGVTGTRSTNCYLSVLSHNNRFAMAKELRKVARKRDRRYPSRSAGNITIFHFAPSRAHSLSLSLSLSLWVPLACTNTSAHRAQLQRILH